MTGLRMVIGALWGLVAPAVGRALATTSLLFLVLLLVGCAAQAYPPAFAFGQSRISGPCERWYEDGALVRERCEGGSIEGGALSDQGATLVRGGVGAARSIAADVIGVPAPPKATAP